MMSFRSLVSVDTITDVQNQERRFKKKTHRSSFRVVIICYRNTNTENVDLFVWDVNLRERLLFLTDRPVHFEDFSWKLSCKFLRVQIISKRFFYTYKCLCLMGHPCKNHPNTAIYFLTNVSQCANLEPFHTRKFKSWANPPKIILNVPFKCSVFQEDSFWMML